MIRICGGNVGDGENGGRKERRDVRKRHGEKGRRRRKEYKKET